MEDFQIELHPINNVIGAPEDDVDRFISKILHTPGVECWGWRGKKDPQGYGHFSICYRPVAAHRMSYELSVAEIPEGFEVHHKCNNRGCVNPNHLEAISHAEHVLKTPSHRKNWTHCKRGHEYTEENTRIYKGIRTCRACVNLRSRWRANPEYEEHGKVSRLYCKANHPLFGDNMYFYETPIAGMQRGCKICRREAVERHREEHYDSIQAARSFRRAITTKRRMKLAHNRIQSLVNDAEQIPASMLVSTLRRLLRWA